MGKKIALLVLLAVFLSSVPAFAESLQGEGGWRDYDRDERKDTSVQPQPRANSDSVREKAEAGDADAQYILGEMYATGQGVPQDYVQAYFWSSLAASRASGDASRQAMDIRDQAAKRLTPEKLKEAQRMTREWEKSHPRK